MCNEEWGQNKLVVWWQDCSHNSQRANQLNHSDHAMHICNSKQAIIHSDNDMSPIWCQFIIWTNNGMFLIEPSGTNFGEIWFTFQKTLFNKMSLKMSFAEEQSICLSLNVLRKDIASWLNSLSRNHDKWAVLQLSCIFLLLVRHQWIFRSKAIDICTYQPKYVTNIRFI